ncbi:MAG: hypothetical protein KatS3mg032_0739 [Cyclobacteriaceae bacterium]|nr:MAG: hypothetical protein KatS3mg032_0739 [Cyclobacteriaceae bacterium]
MLSAKVKFKFILVSVVVLFSSCSEDNSSLTDEEKVLILLNKTWVPGNIQLDGVDITDFGYQNLELRFERNNTWTALNGGDLFGPNGTWQFTNETFTEIQFSGINMQLKLNPQGLTLELVFEKSNDTPIQGRNKSISGNYRIFLLPKYPYD